jgi:DNA-binding CsgD family transcriptional regulator
MGGAGGNTRPGGAMPDNNPLSARETEILQLLAKGMSFNEIGEILGISPHTVTAHIKKIYRKLAVHSRGEAVYEATQMGLLRG